MRLIDADELKKALSDKDLITWTHEYGDAIPLEWIMSTIDNAPTVTPKRGEWLKAINEFFNWECSLCHKPHDFKDNYCPNCGAKMKGEWIEQTEYNGDTYYDCSVCGNSWTTIEGTPWDNGMNFCPNCGAQMKGGVE